MPTRQTDPSGFWGSIVALVGAVFAALAGFGVPLTETQQGLLLAVLVAAGPVVTQLLVRRDAWSPVAHFREVQQAKAGTVYQPSPDDAEAGAVDLAAVLAVLALLVIVLVVVVLVRLL